MSYPTWRDKVLGTYIQTVQGITNQFGIQCVTVDWSWADYLFPTTPIANTISLGDAKTIFDNANPAFFEKIKNTGGPTPNITPLQGDVAVYGPTPTPGYTNQYANPFGHTGVVNNAGALGVYLVQQDGSHQELPAQLKYRAYNFSPLIGFLRPKGATVAVRPMTAQEVSDDYSNYTNGHVQVKPSDPACQNRTENVDPGQGGEFWRGLNNQQLDIIIALDNRIKELEAGGGGTVLTPGNYTVKG